MSLGDFFPDSLRDDFANRNINIGQALLIEIPEIQERYPKYIILIGQNEEEFVVAYVVINSEINENVFPNAELQRLHVGIKKEDHGFLDHDSYVNCSELRIFQTDDVIEFLREHPERAKGNISKAVLRRVQHTISEARTIPRNIKRRFGFI